METEVKLTKLASCAGCGAKVGAGTLVKLLDGFRTHSDPRLLVGYDKSDDASVYYLDENTALVQTTDFFPPIVDDPFLYGQIAAANAISDVYAMGGEPKLALNILCLPESMTQEMVQELLRGGYDKAYEAGARTIACSSTGNAASSLAGNAAAAGFKTYIFVPERAPKGKVAQLMIFGANVISVKGNYEETFKMSAQAIEKYGWYNRNAAINPYLSEGKKTVALEIAEQLNWEMPDYLAISVGDGCTIAGVWKGFKDLYAIGFIDKLPRLISAQSYGCYPINRAIQENKPWEPMEENTIADSISVGVPRNADKALAAIRESNGLAVCVTDEEILAAQRLLGRTCGVFGEPAGVTGAAALKKACEQGLIEKDATVVSVVTGNGLKDVANAIKSAGEPLHIEPDLDLMVRGFAERGVTVE